MIYQLLSFIFYPAILFSVLSYFYHSSYKTIILSKWKSILLFSIATFIILNMYSIWHLSQENFIAYWDFSGFWRRQIELMDIFKNTPSELFRFIYDSILYQEYSSLPQLFLIPHTFIFGITYPRFVLAMLNTFLIPSLITIYIVMLRLISKSWIGSNSVWSISILLIFFTGNYLPLILGYVGSAGLIWIVFSISLLLDFEENIFDTKKALLLGMFFITLVFLRRWFSYYVIAFYGTYYLVRFTTIYKNKINLNNYLHLTKLFVISGLFALLTLIIFFRDLFSTFIGYDYAFAYQSVYSGLEEAFPWFINFYSPFGVLLVSIGLIKTIRNLETRIFGLYLGLSSLLVVILFNQVQILGSHHYYIININILILMFFGIDAFVNLSKSKFYQASLSILISILILSNFLIVFLRQDSQISIFLRDKFEDLSSQLNAPPRQNSNVETIKDMVYFLQAEAKEFEYIYVLSGSGNLNDDMLRNALLPEELYPLPTIEATKSLDTRDGIPKDFFIYTYIVVANPIQYHNGEAFQKVIGILADGIMNDAELKPYYTKIKTFTLNNDIDVYIYKRIDDLPPSLIQKYSDIFRNIYPDYPFLYEFSLYQ